MSIGLVYHLGNNNKWFFISCIQNLHLAILAEKILINIICAQRNKNYTKDKKYIIKKSVQKYNITKAYIIIIIKFYTEEKL